MLEWVRISLDISPLHFFFWNFLDEDISTDDYKTIKEFKDAIFSEFGRLHSLAIDKALTYPRIIHLPAVTLRKRA